MSVCWPPLGSPLTMGMPFCGAAPFMAAWEGEAEGEVRGMPAALALLSRKE